MSGLLTAAGAIGGMLVSLYGTWRRDGRGVVVSGVGFLIALPFSLYAAGNLGWL